MDEQVTTQNKKFECLECKNEVELSDELSVGDVTECPLCGIEYEVTAIHDSGECALRLIEEEK